MQSDDNILQSFAIIARPLPTAMLLLHADGSIVAANLAASSLTDRDENELPGHSIRELVSNDWDSVSRYLDMCASADSMTPGSLTWITPGGNRVASRCEGFTIRNNATGSLILLRVTPREGDTSALQTFDRSVDLLAEELRQRREAEEALRESQERFRRAQQAAHLGTWDWDLDADRIVWDGVEVLHGLPEGYFAGSFDAYTRDIHPEDRAAVLRAIEQARASGEDLNIEYRIVWPDGSLHWVAGRGRCFRDDAGRVVRMSGTCQDISERRRAQQSLEFLASASEVLSSSLRYEETLGSLARLLVPFLADWCAIYVRNPAGIDRVAVVHADPSKTALAERYLEGFPVDLAAPYGPGEVIRSGRPSYMFEGPPPEPPGGPDEGRRILNELGMRSIIITPMTARTRTIGAVSLGMGFSGRTYSESELQLAVEIGRRAGLAVDNAMLFEESERSQAELRRSNEAKDEFLGILAHEIRSPTTTLYGTARIMKSRWKTLDEETVNELLDGMEEQAERLNRLIQNLLVIARVELGREIPREETDVTALLEKTIADYVRRRPSRSLQPDLALLPEANLVPTYVEQVTRNLIENADKYSPADQPIGVHLRPEDNGFIVVVRDRGPGISPDEINLIFESFYRSSQTSGHAAGKGLGLTVCKRLIEAQGGRIWARNRAGGGLEVGFWLPLDQST